MGFMTELSILNDRWGEIRENSVQFIEQVYAVSCIGPTNDYIIGQTSIAKSHHADDIRVYFSGRNSFFDAYPARGMTLERLRYHMDYLKEMKRYIKIAEEATKEAIAKGENK